MNELQLAILKGLEAVWKVGPAWGIGQPDWNTRFQAVQTITKSFPHDREMTDAAGRCLMEALQDPVAWNRHRALALAGKLVAAVEKHQGRG